ncbi:heavy metal-binding domain-containing protein [Lacibacter sp. MH-610]|uniref:heavy metal-binding domain-containing protein n=1 Tax=Lacibacter sp. MH-610 TaxID=3020883 RepID=UPI003892B19C
MNTIKMLLMAAFTIFSVSAMAQQKSAKKNNPQQETSYYCPMKCEGDKTYAKAGKCPKCKMNLKEKKATTAKAYYCPMKCEGDKTYAEAGKCPKCKMNLVEKKEEHSNHKH